MEDSNETPARNPARDRVRPVLDFGPSAGFSVHAFAEAQTMNEEWKTELAALLDEAAAKMREAHTKAYTSGSEAHLAITDAFIALAEVLRKEAA